MSKIKKFHKNDWSEDEDEYYSEKRKPKQKKFNRALKTRDIDYLSNYYDEDEYE